MNKIISSLHCNQYELFIFYLSQSHLSKVISILNGSFKHISYWDLAHVMMCIYSMFFLAKIWTRSYPNDATFLTRYWLCFIHSESFAKVNYLYLFVIRELENWEKTFENRAQWSTISIFTPCRQPLTFLSIFLS